MSTLFISDLHLSADQPQLTQLFLQFLATKAVHAETLYILGDFFEVWIGDDERTELQIQIETALKKLTDSGIKVFLMHGNRDFMLGNEFCLASGCQLISDPFTIQLYGQQILLLHGDSLCTKDTLHMYFRRFTRNKIIRAFYLALPLAIRKNIASFFRGKSKQHIKHLSAETMDVDFDTTKQQFEKSHLLRMIHGHTHRPGIHIFTSNNQMMERIILSDWHAQGNYLEWFPDGKKELNYFS